MPVTDIAPGVNDGAQQIHRTRGPEASEKISYLECLRPLKLGCRFLTKGEVVRVALDHERTGLLFPVDDQVSADRARKLIRDGYAKDHPGPATHKTVAPPLMEKVKGQIRFSVAPPDNPEQAVEPRQQNKGKGSL